MAFEGARGRLEIAAGRCKAQHDAHVCDAPLGEGQLVYLREYVLDVTIKFRTCGARWCIRS